MKVWTWSIEQFRDAARKADPEWFLEVENTIGEAERHSALSFFGIGYNGRERKLVAFQRITDEDIKAIKDYMTSTDDDDGYQWETERGRQYHDWIHHMNAYMSDDSVVDYCGGYVEHVLLTVKYLQDREEGQ